jgi:Lon protease-like protein
METAETSTPQRSNERFLLCRRRPPIEAFNTSEEELPPAAVARRRGYLQMSQDELDEDKSVPVGPAGHEDMQRLVRLIQCPLCSKPYRTPVTLPCGNTLCQQCVPQPYARENATYPDLPGWRQAIECPFADCEQKHLVCDCSVDVTMSKIMDAIAEIVARQILMAGDGTTVVRELVPWDEIVSSEPTAEKANRQTLPGGWLVATYTLAAKGKLYRTNEVAYQPDPPTKEAQKAPDVDILREILEATHQHIGCQVCYDLLLNPVTTFCGHTFCHTCLTRSLDHSLHCPVCRRGLGLPPSLTGQPINKTLSSLLSVLFSETLASRKDAVTLKETRGEGTLNTPLFVHTLGFPHMLISLRIFEPRYRLMLRRCLGGNRQFGMVMYNRYGEPQGDLGNVHFYQYGTMLYIVRNQMLPDGTSLLECRGTYRFCVRAHSIHDGYSVGAVERVEDVSLHEEERLEAQETSLESVPKTDFHSQLNRMPTRALQDMGSDFIKRMRARNANWMQQRVLNIHGQPPSDPALFPFWLASVLPISDEEKYKLLPTTTVRERLKITARWIRRNENQKW